jgi:hypothetical protein|tara:strand:+ start:2211 stop:2708 length:498 start_codon:yes stop_codon:yes gene_type:complete
MNNFLVSIYNKIIEQSKKKFFFEKFSIPDNFNTRLEIFELNLIIILWYMKKTEIEKKNVELLINFFTKDLEYLLRESGESDSSIPRKTRRLVENFYGRLTSYTDEFENIDEKKKNKLVTKLKKNFDSKKIKYELVEVYIYKNIEFFSELEKEDFLNLKFDFFSYI